MYVITIDTGTTNTRVCLWKNLEFIDSVKREVGVRNTSIDGNNNKITLGISDAFQELKSVHNLCEDDIHLILASGMLTSNLGLIEIPHLLAPASINDFSDNIKPYIISEISSSPIYFIPGLKNTTNVFNNSLEANDVMRGEEVESLALLNLTQQQKPTTFILPGSHTKFVSVNTAQKITGCCTTLAGELTAVVTENTILANSLKNNFVTFLDEEFLIQGAKSNAKVGLTRSLFSIRIMEQTTESSAEQIASFLLGIIVSEDINALFNSDAIELDEHTNILIYGRTVVSKAFKVLLDHSYTKHTSSIIDDNISENLSGYGCLMVAKEANLY